MKAVGFGLRSGMKSRGSSGRRGSIAASGHCLDRTLGAGRFYLFIFRERGGREKERRRKTSMCERYIDLVASCMPPSGDLVCKLGMCPEQEWNWQPFGSQAGVQSTEPHQPV